MKKIFGLVLALIMIVSVFAVFPASAEGNEDGKWNVMLNDGINLNYYEGDVKVDSVNVAAKEMAATQTVSGKSTSVEAYLKGLISGEYGEATKALAQALLNYGAAAYEYFAANSDYVGTPVDGEPVTDTTALKGAVATEVSVEDPDGIYIGATLVLDGTMKLRFYFTGNGLEAEYQDNNQTATDKDGYCYFDAPIMPYAMSESVTIVVGDTTVTYAPINYLQAKADDATLSEMVASIYAYGVAAEAYYVTDGCEHKGGIVIDVIKPATLFNEGEQNNYCATCGDLINTSVVNKTTADVYTVTTEHDWNNVPNATGSIKDALGDKTFAPGNDLYLEYSVLFNDTMQTLEGSGIGFGHIANASDVTIEKNKMVKSFSWLYYKDNKSNEWCPFAGGFEFSENVKEFAYGPEWKKNGTESDYTIIQGLDGWHRIGLQYTQNYYEKNGSFTYDVTITVYVDGVKTNEIIVDWGDMFYSVSRVNGELVYTQNKDIANYYAVFYRVGNGYLQSGKTDNAYVVFADCYLSVGDGFVVNVSPIANPEATDFIQDGVTLSGKQYYKINTLADCAKGDHAWAAEATVDKNVTCTENGQKSIKCTVCGDIKPDSVEAIPAGHSWAAEATVDKNVTCTENGQKSIKCTVCGDIKPDSVEVIPSAGQHVWSNETTAKIATVFSDGLKTGTCSACGEALTEVLPKTEAEVYISDKTTTNSSAYNKTGSIKDALGDKTFKPGNDLYLEYSILFNSTMKNIEGSGIGWGHIASKSDFTLESSKIKLFSWLYFKDNKSNEWCPFAGGFEFSEGVKEFVFGPEWKKNTSGNPSRDDYTIIDGLDGWHRIGLQYHQNVYENNGEFTYDVTLTVYVDGKKTNEIIVDWGAMFYSAERVNGDIVYTQNENINNYYAVFYRIGNPRLQSGDNAYFVFADCYLSVGDGFVLNVSSVENPEAQEFTQDGVTLSGKQYFTVNN